MKARLLATAILLGVSTGCAGPQHAHEEDAQPATAAEVLDDLTHDLDRRPYWGSSLRWLEVYSRMVAVGVEPEEASSQIRRAALTTISAQDVDILLEKNPTSEAFLVALDALYLEVVGASGKTSEVEIAYGLPSTEAVELWDPFARSVDRPPRCGNSLHWLPVYKDLMRLGYSEKGAIRVCWQGLRGGVGRFEVEELIDQAKRDRAVFAAKFEQAVTQATAERDTFPGFGVKAFFRGKNLSPKEAPLTADVGPREEAAPVGAPTEAPAMVDEPAMDDEPADAPFSDEVPGDVPMEEPPADAPGDEPPADVPSDEPPADVPSDEPPADVPSDEPGE